MRICRHVQCAAGRVILPADCGRTLSAPALQLLTTALGLQLGGKGAWVMAPICYAKPSVLPGASRGSRRQEFCRESCCQSLLPTCGAELCCQRTDASCFVPRRTRTPASWCGCS